MEVGMYKYIIFDIDGTVLDTETAVLSSLQKVVLEELNKSLSFDELKFTLGIPGEVTLVCADDTEKHKPNPDPILKFLEVSGADKSKTIYIGDTKYDMQCALDAGIDFALALWGAKSSVGINANYILENPKQILQLIEG
jgi:phosphoglycolate phosphatase-like HAD superfamily hydrolase